MTVESDTKTQSVDIDEHMLSIEEVLERYQVKVDTLHPANSDGLDKEIVTSRLAQYGPNVMSPPKKIHPILKYLISLSNLFNVLLIVSGVLCYILFAIDSVGNATQVYIGAVLIGVAMINAMIEFVQEMKSESIMQGFLNLVPRNCTVIREKSLTNRPAADLVRGDLVNIRMGDKIPADIRIIWASDFKVDNSSLTGEADPQERGTGNKHNNVLEAANVAFGGTLAVNGEAFGVVIRTGDSTVLGQIANLAGGESKRVSPMQVEISSFVQRIASVATVTAIVFFIVGMLSGNTFAFNLNFAIGVFVSFVPEGLPATVTLLLSFAAQRMAKRNVLVKDLRGVETLGAITCLATDKTGTLTRNQMTVTLAWSGEKLFDASSKNVTASTPSLNKTGDVESMQMDDMPKLIIENGMENAKPFDATDANMDTLMHISYLCSKARFNRTDVPIDQREIIADATESGLFAFAAKNLKDSDNLLEKNPKVFEVPFNSTNKYALTIHKKKHDNGLFTLFIKGAPERVIKLCSSFQAANGPEAMNDSRMKQFTETYELMAGKGHRVIGCAQMLLSEEQYGEGFYFLKEDTEEERAKALAALDVPASSVNMGAYPTSGYTFMGLISLEDPPKHGVREAIGKCRQAGIKVMMVTGDHPLTAEAIGRKINLMLQETKEMVARRTGRPIETIAEDEYNSIVIHGEVIDKLTDDDWDRILTKQEIIFARTSPKHKLQIVKRLQAIGHIVGVTGDGVNDSPALKKADLGISMNISGSDVSKEAAAMILLDDNFASTVYGIMEGRLIFQNLKKSIRYTITHTTPEVAASIAYLVGPVMLPLNPILTIFIDLGFEMFNALGFAWEPAENGMDGLMTELPRKPVTNRSIEILRRENAYNDEKKEELHQMVYGSEVTLDAANEKPKTLLQSFYSLGARIKYFFKHLNDSEMWDLTFIKKEEQVLVDSELLSYSYLEMGMLEAIALFIGYFFVFYHEKNWSPSEVQSNSMRINTSTSLSDSDKAIVTGVGQIAQANYYFGIFILQAFNLFISKASNRLPFGKYMFMNKANWYGLIAGGAFAYFVVYPSFMWTVFQTAYLNPIYWLVPIAMGLVMLTYGTLRIIWMRSKKTVNFNMSLPLDLHPTRFSTKGN